MTSPQSHARTHKLPRKVIKLQVPVITDHKPLLSIEHCDALRDVVQSGVELNVLLLEARLQRVPVGYVLVN